MNNKYNSLPMLRFPEFSGEWTQYKLGECFDERNEQFPESSDYPLMAFIAGKGVTEKGEKYDRSALVKDAPNKKYKRTELGDFIYSSNNLESGSIGLNRYGKACISPVYSIFKAKKGFDPYFIGTILTQKSFISEMIKYRQGVVYGQWKIPEKEFLNLIIRIPSFGEQQRIAEFLEAEDRMIAAQEQKVEFLKTHKKGLMQQLFPQPGTTTPALRFPGFTGDWEVKKLGEIADVNPKSDKLPNKFVYIDLESVESGNLLKKNIIEVKNAPSRAQRLLKKGDILFQMVRPYQRNNYHFYDNDVNVYVASTGYAQIRYKDCSEYLYQYLHTDTFVDMAVSKCVGGNYPAINTTDLTNITVYLPSPAEQQMIAECLGTLDNLIAAESKKLGFLKSHKKGLMQQLFPQPEK
jgi:type I restriction enzyme S subunit